ncbi:hypothetical protein NMG60_11007433 [Bertholletia excelsa]
MEQQQKAEEKKPEAEQISGQEQVQKPDPAMDANAGGAAGPANGEAGKPEADVPPLDHNSGDNNINSNGVGHNKPTLNHTRSKKSVRWSEDLVVESPSSRTMHYVGAGGGSNAYVASSPTSSYSTSLKDSVSTVRDVLGRWGRKVGEATRKAEDLAGNTWQHLKTAPSIADAALGRIAQGTKVLAEGGYEKIFRQSFETVPEEQLLNSYACYLSTSAGPVMGVLYVSTAKLAFCSDNPLSYKSGDRTEWSYYKVVIPFHQINTVNPSSSRSNPAEKYIQVISVDNHEFWFMGFLNYNSAVVCLQDGLLNRNLSV